MVARSRTLIRRILHFGSMVGIGLSGAQAQSPIDGALPDALTSRTARCCLTVTTTTLVVGTAASFIALDRAWYSGYDRSPFHFFNDGAEWLQMDKTGHFFSTYTLGSWSNAMLRRCGMQERRARWVGGSVGLVLLTGVEDPGWDVGRVGVFRLGYGGQCGRRIAVHRAGRPLGRTTDQTQALCALNRFRGPATRPFGQRLGRPDPEGL